MPLCTLSSMYSSPWGIIGNRRTEVENGPYGHYDKVMNEEIKKKFMSIGSVSELIGLQEAAARRWMTQYNARYISREGKNFYFKEDVDTIIGVRIAEKERLRIKKNEKEQRKKKKSRKAKK